MKVFATLFLVATVLLGITVASLNIPIIGWSSNKVFTQSEILETYSADQFKELLVSMVKSTQPELITIFVEPKLRTDDLSKIFDSYNEKPESTLQSIKDSIQKAASTIYIPYVASSGSFVSSVMKSVSTSLDGSIIVASDSEFHVDGAQEINLNQLQFVKNLISNKKVDILVVVLPTQNQNSIVNQVFQITKSVETVSFFTGENATPLEHSLAYEPVVEKLSLYSYSLGNGTSNTTGNSTNNYFNFFPGPIIEAYLVIGIMLAIFFTGLCCILDLQVPDRYEAPKQKMH